MSSSAADAQETCDPFLDPTCDPGFEPPPDFEPPINDPGPCDPFFDPTCDPGFSIPPDLPPGACDPFFDPTCDPGFDPLGDPGYQAFLDENGGCDPFLDPTCDPGFDPLGDPGYQAFLDENGGCDPFLDPTCGATPPTTAAPQPVVTTARDSPAFETVASRADTSDDIAVEAVPDDQVATVAASRLVLGLDAMAEIGAFRRAPNPKANDVIREVRDQVPSDGLTDDGYRREIERLAADLPKLVAQLESSGQEISDELRRVVAELDADSIQAILAGDTSVVDPELWIAALADLSVRGGGAPTDLSERADDGTAVLGIALLFVHDEPEDEAPEALAAVVEEPATEPAPTTVAPTTTAPGAATNPTAADDSSPGSPPLALIAAIAAAVLALGFVAMRGRSKNRESDAAAQSSKLSVTDLLDASRRMTSSLDAREISGIALAEAERLVASEGGLIAIRGDDGLVAVHCEPQALFVLDALEKSSLKRVIETGRSIATVASDEPVLVEVPMSMAAVPIVSDGTITGAIMVVRIASEPFARDDIEALEMLAPLVGSAFQAAEAHDSATALADVEPMTGLKNRRRLDKDLAATGNDLVAYIMLDVDHFKNFNDMNGHAAGDEALRSVATTIAECVRPNDVVYRYGGEEFCVLLPDSTSDQAIKVAERIRAGVEACEVPGEENQPGGTLTVSVGVADTASKSHVDLIERADGALYEAKHNGRNQVQIEKDESL